jgi:hypothetical protein
MRQKMDSQAASDGQRCHENRHDNYLEGLGKAAKLIGKSVLFQPQFERFLRG